MAYRIVYGPEPTASKKAPKPRSKLPILIACFILVFLFLVRTYWPEGRQALTQLLLPGDPAATELAIRAMLLELETGSPVSDAIAVFCREVLSSASLG